MNQNLQTQTEIYAATVRNLARNMNTAASLAVLLAVAAFAGGTLVGADSMMTTHMGGIMGGCQMAMTPEQCQAMHEQMGMTPEQCQAMHEQMAGTCHS